MTLDGKQAPGDCLIVAWSLVAFKGDGYLLGKLHEEALGKSSHVVMFYIPYHCVSIHEAHNLVTMSIHYIGEQLWA